MALVTDIITLGVWNRTPQPFALLKLTPYITMAEFDLSREVDVAYTWKCNPLEYMCEDTNDRTWRGWVIFIALMVVFLAKDVICGLKVVNLSGKKRHSHSLRVRLFSGGVILWGITVYTVYVSAIYIQATATSDTELVTDAAVILFIMELDEKLFELIKAHASSWMDGVFGANKQQQEEDKQDKNEAVKNGEKRHKNEEEKEEEKVDKVDKEQDEDGCLAVLKSKVEKLEGQVEMLCNKLQDYEERDIEKGEEDHGEEE